MKLSVSAFAVFILFFLPPIAPSSPVRGLRRGRVSDSFRESWTNCLLPIAFCLLPFTFYLLPFTSGNTIRTGAERTEIYLPWITAKNVAVVANQTSRIGETHIVDTLLSMGISIKRVFAPEHGFRGAADAGEHVKNFRDTRTGLPVVSLYGNNKKPKHSDLKDVDAVIFDIQDVGVRYYTYISTMHYVMEACAENGKEFVVLDRPNPNGFYVDGPVLNEKFRSFVGMHPIALVHGLTVAELSQMINGEGWLRKQIKCNLKIVSCENYSHSDHYSLPVKPSPNLPDMLSVYLYPSLGWFEGTIVSVGRGTDKPFKVIGHPDMLNTAFSYTPNSLPGAKNPPYNGQICKGFDLSETDKSEIIKRKEIYLQWLINSYNNTADKKKFFIKTEFFNLLCGTDKLKRQIINSISEDEIRKSWQKELEEYKKLRKKYLLYKDFE